MPMSATVFLLSKILLSAWALRAEVRSLPEIGRHFPLFTFEKNENPQNIMVIYVKLDDEGRLVQDPKRPRQPLIGFYWLMNREKYKPVHPLIVHGIRERLHFVSEASDRRSFRIRLSDLDDLKQDMKSTDIDVKVVGKKEPTVEASLTLGPSDRSREIQIDKIYSKAHKTFLPPFRKVDAITVFGQTVAGGDPVSRTYSAR
jgi:hypothetical protein